MTFASDSQKSGSERFMLVRITPRRYMSTGTSIGGSQYTFTLASTINITAVTVNDATEGTWTHVGDLLTVTSATDLTNAANIVTIDHDIYVTGNQTRYTESISGVPDAEWQPLLEQYPAFSQSMRNIAEGVFSLSNSQVTLISTDRWGQSLLGENDSFSKAPVSVWVCIDTESSNRKVFDGEVSSVSYSYGKFSLDIIDTFSKLKNSASFGTYDNSHVYTGNPEFTSYPNPGDENSVIPLSIGKSSPFSVSTGWRHLDSFGATNGNLYHLSKGQKCAKLSPQTPTGASTITFMLGRIVGSDLKKINFGTISAAYELYVEKSIRSGSGAPTDTINIFEKILYLTCSTFNGEIGDYIPDVSGWVCGYGSGLWGSYNLAIACPVYGFSQNDSGNIANPSGSIAVPSIPNNSIPSVSMWVDAGDSVDYEGLYYPLALIPSGSTRMHSRRYLKFTPSVVTAETVGGETISHVFATVSPSANSLDTDHGINQLSSSNIMCRMSPNTEMSHADALKFVIKSSGMTTNDTTFSDAETALSANVSMTVPANDANQFSSYLDVAQSITSSTLGILRVNEDREVEYELLDNPDGLSIDSTRDEINMLSGDTDVKIEYQDIYSEVQFLNPQLNNLDAINGTGPKAVVESDKARQLHRIQRTKTIEHVLESIQNRKAAIAGYFSAATVQYSLSTAAEDLTSNIGDVVEITNTAVADDSETVKGIITSLDQGGSKTTIRVNEIRGVP